MTHQPVTPPSCKNYAQRKRSAASRNEATKHKKPPDSDHFGPAYECAACLKQQPTVLVLRVKVLLPSVDILARIWPKLAVFVLATRSGRLLQVLAQQKEGYRFTNDCPRARQNSNGMTIAARARETGLSVQCVFDSSVASTL